MLNGCDMLNRALHDRCWPHKKGGRDMLGDRGMQDNFAFSSIIQNTIKVINSLNSDSYEAVDFKSFCLDLSDELYDVGCSLT